MVSHTNLRKLDRINVFFKIQIRIRPDPNLQPCYTSLYLRTYHAAFQLENVYNAKDKKPGLLFFVICFYFV